MDAIWSTGDAWEPRGHEEAWAGWERDWIRCVRGRHDASSCGV